MLKKTLKKKFSSHFLYKNRQQFTPLQNKIIKTYKVSAFERTFGRRSSDFLSAGVVYRYIGANASIYIYKRTEYNSLGGESRSCVCEHGFSRRCNCKSDKSPRKIVYVLEYVYTVESRKFSCECSRAAGAERSIQGSVWHIG